MRLHWQNLNEKPTPKGKPTRVGWPYRGRFWLWYKQNSLIEFSWDIWTKFCGLSLSMSREYENNLSFHISFPPISIWLTFEGRRLRRLAELFVTEDYSCERKLSVKIHGGSIWWMLWMPTMESKADDPSWRTGNFNPIDFIFGRRKYTDLILDSGSLTIPMPESNYSGEYKLTESSWVRPRWPWCPLTKRCLYGNIDMKEMIPIPGKGENAWDCGQDGLWGLSCPAKNKAELISRIVESVMRDRLRRGHSEFATE